MKLIESFKCAISGILLTLRTERNFRIHIVIILYVLYFASFYDFSRTEYIILLLLFGGVTAAEMFNTAVEHVVDLVEEKYHVQAKIAKDIAAGGVLIMALCAASIGILLFWDMKKITEIVKFLMGNPLSAFLLLCFVVLSYFYIKKAEK